MMNMIKTIFDKRALFLKLHIKKREATVVVFAFFISMLLTACGGGDDFSHPSQRAPSESPQIHAETNTQNENEVQWGAMQNASGYRVYYSTDSSFPSDKTTVVNTGEFRFVPTGNNETIYVAVSALWGEHEGPRSGVIAVVANGTTGTTTPLDPLAPKILAVFPAANKTDVDNENLKKIEISFDRAMLPASLNTDTFRVSSSGHQVTGQVSYDAVGKTASFIPEKILWCNTIYTVELSKDIRDVDNHSLTNGFKSSFATKNAVAQISSVRVSESSNIALVTVSLNLPSSNVAIDFATKDSSAIAGADYTSTSGTIGFGSSDLSSSFTIPIINDDIYEGSEKFNIEFSNFRGVVANTIADVTIDDDEVLPTIKIQDVTISESLGNVQLVLVLDRPSKYPISFVYYATNGTATSGVDFAETPNTAVEFLPGEIRKTTNIAVVNDSIPEDDEIFYIRTMNAQNVSSPQNDTIVKIENDDVPNAPVLNLVNGDGQVTLSWLPSEGATSYNVYYARQTNVTPANYGALTGGAALIGATSPRVIANLNNGIDHFFVVSAQAGTKESLPSNQTGAQPRSIQPRRPKLNDTGVNTCSNANANRLTCPQQNYLRQDGDIGRDADARNKQLVKVGGGNAGFDFTKMDNRGQPLASQNVIYTTNPWDCVRDNVTGLWWEVKTTDLKFRDKNWTYSWYSSINNAGVPGTANGGVCFDKANTASCDTEKFTAQANKAGICGFNDWRLPNRIELETIVDHQVSSPGPTIDVNYFPDTISGDYWSSSPYYGNVSAAWSVTFNWTGAIDQAKTSLYPVRLVRGGQQ